jgi:hypothetical protein
MPKAAKSLRAGKLPEWSQNNTGLVQNPGPYIGIVKWNSDPTRSGRLQVYVPALGGSDPEDSAHWYTVSYASPFRGKTQGKVDSFGQYIQAQVNLDSGPDEENSFQSYGMWFVPPDLGVRVLCLFLDGDPAQGYWFACLNDSFDSHMTPGIGSADSGVYVWDPNELKTHQKLRDYIELSSKEIPSRLPVSEAIFSDQVDQNGKPNVDIDSVKKLPHVYQSLTLGKQGLAFDFVRGCVSSSSLRESPSQVFGISTPGRLWNMSDQKKSQEFLASGTETDLLKNFRTGGHQLVMDDGTTEGLDQFIRIRTTRGNMILLDDTNEQIYIVNAAGTAWIEMTPSGRIDIFTENDFSVRSKGDINFHTEKDFNLHVRGKIQVRSEQTTTLESVGDLTMRSESASTLYSKGKQELGTSSAQNLYSSAGTSIRTGGDLVLKGSTIYLNTKSGNIVNEPTAIKQKKHPKTQPEPGKKTWWMRDDFESIVSRAPEHEPWRNHEKFTVKSSTPPPSGESKRITRTNK